MLYVTARGRDPSAAPGGPGQQLIVELTQRGKLPKWEAGNPDDARAIEAIQRFDADDRYVVVRVQWEWRGGFLWSTTMYAVRYYRYDRHGREPWSPTEDGILLQGHGPSPALGKGHLPSE